MNARKRIDQLIRLALDRGASLEEARTAAHLAVRMIDDEQLLDRPERSRFERLAEDLDNRDEDRVEPAPRGAKRLGTGTRELPPAPASMTGADPNATFYVLHGVYAEPEPEKERAVDYVFPPELVKRFTG